MVNWLTTIGRGPYALPIQVINIQLKIHTHVHRSCARWIKALRIFLRKTAFFCEGERKEWDEEENERGRGRERRKALWVRRRENFERKSCTAGLNSWLFVVPIARPKVKGGELGIRTSQPNPQPQKWLLHCDHEFFWHFAHQTRSKPTYMVPVHHERGRWVPIPDMYSSLTLQKGRHWRARGCFSWRRKKEVKPWR